MFLLLYNNLQVATTPEPMNTNHLQVFANVKWHFNVVLGDHLECKTFIITLKGTLYFTNQTCILVQNFLEKLKESLLLRFVFIC